MSKYYKAEDVIRAIEEMQNGYNGWSDRYNRDNHRAKNHKPNIKVKIEHDGETHTLKEWSEILGVKLSTLTNRYYRGDRGERLFRTVIERR